MKSFLVRIDTRCHLSGSIPLPHSVQFSSVAQSCPTLCKPMNCSLQGSSVHGILQARILEWVAIPFSRGSSLPRDRTCLLHFRQILYHLSHQGSPILNMVPIKNKQKRNCFWRSQLVSTNSTQISRDSTTT